MKSAELLDEVEEVAGMGGEALDCEEEGLDGVVGVVELVLKSHWREMVMETEVEKEAYLGWTMKVVVAPS